MKKILSFFTLLAMLASMTSAVYAHCQIPCGIFEDHVRFTLLREHITTIEKSMKQIDALSADPAKNMNQLVRWVNNKDHHADEFSEIITYYFLAQRIKLVDASDAENFATYQSKLTTVHQLVFYAMKSKQSTDLSHISKLNELVDTFEKQYFSPEDLEHLKEHKN